MDKTLYQMTLTIESLIVLTPNVHPLMKQNHHFNTASKQVVNEMLCRIAPTGDQTINVQSLQQLISRSEVMALSICQGKCLIYRP